jgi:hypothetical protein
VKYNCCGVAPDFGSGGKAIFSLDAARRPTTSSTTTG